MTIKKGDFIELDYTGKISGEDTVFDTTIQQVAEDAGLLHKHEEGHDHDHSDQYSPVVVCVGERHLLPGLDKKVEGLNIGKHTIELKDTEAFGKKDAKLLTMIPMTMFQKQDIKPFVGLELNIDGKLGVVRSVSAGRTMVDFNHPMASKDVVYDIDVKRLLSDDKEKLDALMKMVRIPHKGVEIKDGTATLDLTQEIPDQYLKMFSDDVDRLIGLKLEYKRPSDSVEKKE